MLRFILEQNHNDEIYIICGIEKNFIFITFFLMMGLCMLFIII